MLEKLKSFLGFPAPRQIIAEHPATPAQPPKPARRWDSFFGMPFFWNNLATGMGGSGDNASGWMPGPIWPLDYEILRRLYNGHGISRRIVSSLPNRAFAEGFRVVYSGSRKLEARRHQKQIEQEVVRLRLPQRAHEAAAFGRLWGGSVILVSTKDGPPDQPIRPRRVRRIESLVVVGAPRAYPTMPSLDPMSDDANRRYPDHTMYYVSPYGMNRTMLVHPSRLAVFGGAPSDSEDRWRYYRGWDASWLQVAWDEIRRMGANDQAIASMLSKASRKIIKTRLWDIITGRGGADALDNFRTRLALMQETESSMNLLPLDLEETYEFINQTFSGVSEITDRDRLALAAVLDMPIAELFGEAPRGLSATGEFDAKKWIASVIAYQAQQLTEPIEWIIWLIALAVGSSDPENWGIEWPHPSVMTAKEEAELQKLVADTDMIYLQAGFDPNRLFAHRFAPGGYNPEPPTLPESDVLFMSASADQNYRPLEPGEEGT